MSQIILFEDHQWSRLLPLLYWRSVFELRVGRRTVLDRIVQQVGRHPSGLWTRDWMAEVAAHRCQLPTNQPIGENTVLVNGRWLPRKKYELKPGPLVVKYGDEIVYIVCDANLAGKLTPEIMMEPDRLSEILEKVPTEETDARLLHYPWDLISFNHDLLCSDWTSANCSIDGEISSSAYVNKPDWLHVGEDSVILPCAILDTEKGPIHVSHNVTIEPHTFIAGPAYIGAGTIIKSHTSIRGGTTIGPLCEIGGEVNASIINGYTNKGCEGYIGHCLVGSWVGIGPGTANTDIKSTYGHVRVVCGKEVVDSGLSQFGAIIGDHSRVGTGQKIPNGAVIGFAANMATGRFLPKFVPSYSWLTDSGLEKGNPQRLLEFSRLGAESKNVGLIPAEEKLFAKINEVASEHESQAGDMVFG